MSVRRLSEEISRRFDARMVASRAARGAAPPSAPADTVAAREARAAAARARKEGDSFRDDFGEFAQAIARSAVSSSLIDPRLVRATGLNELDPSQGGFAIPTTFLDEIIPDIFYGSVLSGLVDLRETTKPLADVRIPGFDETTRADGGRLGGVLSSWLNDGTAIPTNFPRWRNLSYQGNSLFVATAASSELVADAPLLGSYLKEAIISEFGYRLDSSLITGKGFGVPLGIVNAPATIICPKQVGQASATLVEENIRDMWARMPGPMRRTCVWAGNADVESALDAGAFAFSNLYMPAGSDGDASPRIKGRPLLITEGNPVLGQVGDIVLFNPMSYMWMTNPVRSAMSVHAHFLQDEVVFKWVWRIDGKPKYSSSVTPNNGGNPQSPFVALSAR
jgi:HK97 family phage major capsid protein